MIILSSQSSYLKTHKKGLCASEVDTLFLTVYKMDTSVAVYPSTVISGGDTNMQGDDLRTEEPLSMKEMDIIKSLDSRSFGFLDLNHSTLSGVTPTSLSSDNGISFVSKDFLMKGIQMLRVELLSEMCTESLRSKILCQIAHLHLLLEQYTEALSAYQNYAVLSDESSCDTSFLYGIALIYFACGKYDWSLQAFQKILILSPSFARLSEVHVRIGIIMKTRGDIKNALKHFNKALIDSGPCSITKLEIQFHIGHIHHINGDYLRAKHNFELILASKNVPNDIKALTLRQLGWLYHTIPQISTRNENPHLKAIELLKLAVGANPSCGQAWYFLGRCHADQGQYREAFMAYRQSVSRVENQADTWCAIGILYQQMAQARDSLQAYVTAVFFSQDHSATWTDLGLLYESCDQLVDAYLCYKNGLTSLHKSERDEMSLESVREILTTRLNVVEQQIQQSGGISSNIQQSRSLPTLNEAWSSLVPQHFREKYPLTELPLLQLPMSSYPVVSPSLSLSPGLNRMNGQFAKRQKTKSKDPIILKNISEGWSVSSQTSQPANALTSPSLNRPDLGDNSLNPLHVTNPLSLGLHEYPLGLNQQYMSYQQPAPIVFYPDCGIDSNSILSPESVFFSPQNVLSNGTSDSVTDISPSIDLLPDVQNSSTGLQNISYPVTPLIPTHNYPDSQTTLMDTHSYSPVPFADPSSALLPQDFSTIRPLNVGSNHVQPNMGGYFQFRRGHYTGPEPYENEFPLGSPTISESRLVLGKRLRERENSGRASPSKLVARIPSQLSNKVPSEALSNKESSLKSPHSTIHHNPAHSSIRTSSEDVFTTVSHPHSHSGNLSDTSSGVSSAASMKRSNSDHSSPLSSPYHTHSPMSVRKESVEVEEIIPIYVPHPGLSNKEDYMQEDVFCPPSPPPENGDIDLHPDVPIFSVSSYREAMSTELHSICSDPNVPICIIKGVVDAVGFDMNIFSTNTLMKQCGDHDVEIREQFHQAADKNWDQTGKKQVWRCESNRSWTTVQEYGEYQQLALQEERKNNNRATSSGKMLKFGTNCDLSDKQKWRKQLKEISKLPKFIQVECPEANLLNHVGHTVLGMNSVQLYLKVPGCRTPGHQENNNFCSVNINIGPGDCEWFGVANKYWGIMHQLCEKHKICFLKGSWWPILDELEELNIPVYRFTQYEGEIVWINPGTVHWVQANSTCNNVAWNVGPLTAHQMRMSWERYKWNKVMKVRSIVPMITLTWNFAKNVKLTDPHICKQMSVLLYSSYRQCELLLNQLHNAGVPLIWHGKMEGELTPTCTVCAEEVFNILFVSTNKKGDHLVHCHKCVQQIQTKNKKATFTVLQQYTLTELQKILSKFIPLPSTKTR